MIKYAIRFGLIALVLYVLLAFAGLLYATSDDDFTLSWFTINAGGKSSGEGWELISVLGQPDVTISTGGDYTLEGGFLHSYHLVYLPLVLHE